MPQEEGRRLPRSLVNFLRDLAVAFLLVAIVFAALFAFARTWPPMVVVESGSMQHSDTESFIGVVDTGDIVVVQTAPLRQDVATYVQGRAPAAGYGTYGDFGDVIVFQDPVGPPGRWIIHRALVFLAWNNETNGFDIPTLESLEKGVDWESNAATPFGLGPGDSVVLMNVRGRDVTIRMNDFLPDRDLLDCPDSCEGYVTMGDNNPGVDSALVFQDLILGRARGELPWFGLLKLTFAGPLAWGDTGRGGAPANSWTALTVSLILLIAGPIGLDVGLSLVAARRKEEPANPGEHAPDANPDGDEGPPEEGEDPSAK